MNDAEMRAFCLDHNMTEAQINDMLDDGYPMVEIYEACGGGKELPLEGEGLPPGVDPWQELVPFDEETLPPFPAEVLPWPLDAVVKQLSNSLQVDPSMVGVLALGFLAALFQGKFRLHVKPDFDVELSLYTCAVAAPGERKTPVFRWLSAPVEAYEAERQAAEAPEVQRNQQQKKILLGQQKELETKLIRGASVPDGAGGQNGFNRKKAEWDLENINQQLDEYEDQYAYQILTDDATNEALVDLLDKHGAILMASDEPGLFTSLKGRYEPNSGFDVYLKAIDGSSIRVSRVTRPGNKVEHPHLSLALGAQPAAVRSFVNNPVFSGRGLVQRFLFANCKGFAGSRRWETEPVSLATTEGWQRLVYDALNLSYDKPVTLHFTEEAQAEAARFADEAEAALRDGGRLDFDRGWANKFPGFVFRLAALLQLVEAVMNDLDPAAPVDKDWLVSAERLGWVLAEHTKSIFTEAGADQDTEDARYIWRRLVSIGKMKVSKGDLLKKCQAARFAKANAMDPGLDILEQRGYIRTWTEQTGKKGRPPVWIALNPAALNT